MIAVCLFIVLAAAKVIALAGRDVPLSAFAPFAFFWQDVLAALLFFAVEVAGARRLPVWLLYGAAVLYVAINVPVTLVLGTPLTLNMLRAAGGPLADSIRHYVTPLNVGSLLLILGAGAALPVMIVRRASGPAVAVICGAVLFSAVGMEAGSRVETRGLHRNAFGALISSAGVEAGRPSSRHAVALSHVGEDRWMGAELQHLRGVARGRNVILIVLESTAARYLGLYGAGRDPMPALTNLSRHAIVFDHAYAVYPESIKGLFSTLCSRFPAFNVDVKSHAQAPCASLARRLSDAGYRTALFHSGRFEYLGMASMIEGRGFDVLEDAGVVGGKTKSSFGVDEPSVVRRMLDWIDSLNPGERFFLMYLPVAGHHPYASANGGPFDEESDFGRYLNALHDADTALAGFIRGLRARGLDERSMVVVQGDHGEAFGQHPDNYAHSLFIYDENVRVPYLIALPGALKSQIRVSRIASAVDTAPTILDLLGQPAAAGHQGMSLLTSGSRTAFFYTDYSLGWLGLRKECWKYLYETEARRSKLFDVCRDPDEAKDVSAERGELVADFRDQVQRWAAAQVEAVNNRRSPEGTW